MTGRDGMTDEQVRAKLTKEQLQAVTFVDIDGKRQFICGLKPLARDLAASQRALGEIAAKTDKLKTSPPTGHTISIVLANVLVAVNKIARTAWKGGK